jgi:hypothetical protein
MRSGDVLARFVVQHVPAGDQEQLLITPEEEAAGVGQRLLLMEGRDARCGKEDGFNHGQPAAGSGTDGVAARKARRAERARAGLITRSADSSRWPAARSCHIFNLLVVWIWKTPWVGRPERTKGTTKVPFVSRTALCSQVLWERGDKVACWCVPSVLAVAVIQKTAQLV